MDPEKVSPEDLPEVPEVRRQKGAIRDASFGDCIAEPGEQTVSASVTNSTEEPTDYVVTVSWVNDTSDVLARAVEVARDLEPGASDELELVAEVPRPATSCTFHVVRGNVR